MIFPHGDIKEQGPTSLQENRPLQFVTLYPFGHLLILNAVDNTDKHIINK